LINSDFNIQLEAEFAMPQNFLNTQDFYSKRDVTTEMFQAQMENMIHHYIKCGYVISKLLYLFLVWDVVVLWYST
jgi:hemolysin activation/secretion protein